VKKNSKTSSIWTYPWSYPTSKPKDRVQIQ